MISFIRQKNAPPQEYTQVVWCPTCDYCLRITVQSRRGDHFCATCGGEMAVYEPRVGDRVSKPHLYAPPSGPSALSRSVPPLFPCDYEWDDDLGHRKCELVKGHTSEKHEARIPPTTKSGSTPFAQSSAEGVKE